MLTFYSQAQITFQKIYGTENVDECKSIQITSDGGYILAGSVSVPDNLTDMYLIKANSEGEIIWSRTYGGTNFDNAVYALQTNDGGYIVAGQSVTEQAGDIDILIVKTDASGTMLWSKKYGSIVTDKAMGIEQTTDGGYIIFGYYAYGLGAYLIKIDENGNITWTKAYGGKEYAIGYAAHQTTDGGYMLMGRIVDSISDYVFDIMLVKTDSKGDTLWTSTFGGPGEDDPYSAKQTNDGGYIITGRTYSFGAGSTDVFLTKTDENGIVLWTKTYGGPLPDSGEDVVQTSDGGYIISGHSESFGNGASDFYLIRVDEIGDTLWTRTYGGVNGDYAYSIQQTADNGFAVVGTTNSFGEEDNNNIYFVKTNADGISGCNQQTTQTLVTSQLMQNSNLQVLHFTGGTMYVPEIISASIETNTVTLCANVGVDEYLQSQTLISIYPNPFSSTTTLKTTKMLKNATLTIFNSLGKEVKEIENISGQEIILDRKNLQVGIYFIRLKLNNKTIADGKLIVTD